MNFSLEFRQICPCSALRFGHVFACYTLLAEPFFTYRTVNHDPFDKKAPQVVQPTRSLSGPYNIQRSTFWF
jgi:hypothetical protein